MSGHDEPQSLTRASRAFLEGFLRQVRRGNLPGSGELIERLERMLRLPSVDADDLE